MLRDLLEPGSLSRRSRHPWWRASGGSGPRQSTRRSCLRLAQRGYVGVSIDYRLAPASQFPTAVQDVKSAVRFLRANAAKYSVDPERIAALGDSAGATLALLLGLTPGAREFEGGGPNRTKCFRPRLLRGSLPARWPIWQHLAPQWRGDKDFAPSWFLGESFDNTRRVYAGEPGRLGCAPQAAPVLAIHGTKDSVVPLEQSQRLVEQLKGVGASAEHGDRWRRPQELDGATR